MKRAEILRGLAEAHARLDRGAEAVRAAAEAAELFEAAGRSVDAALASYWLAAGLFYQGQHRRIQGSADRDPGQRSRRPQGRTGLQGAALDGALVEQSREGNHQGALSYLEEVRGLADILDDRRRAAFLFDLAYSYCELGDFEAAIRVGYASLALYSASNTVSEMAKVENEMALAHLGAGSIGKAADLAASAHEHFARLGNERQLAHVLETQAQIAAAKSDWAEALRLSQGSLDLAVRSENLAAQASAGLTAARCHVALGDPAAAERSFADAADAARRLNRPVVLRRVLSEWADLLAAQGDHAAAFALSREALDSAR